VGSRDTPGGGKGKKSRRKMRRFGQTMVMGEGQTDGLIGRHGGGRGKKKGPLKEKKKLRQPLDTAAYEMIA